MRHFHDAHSVISVSTLASSTEVTDSTLGAEEDGCGSTSQGVFSLVVVVVVIVVIVVIVIVVIVDGDRDTFSIDQLEVIVTFQTVISDFSASFTIWICS